MAKVWWFWLHRKSLIVFRMNLNGNLIDTHIVISFLVDISYLLCKQRYTKMTEWARKMGNNLKNKWNKQENRGRYVPSFSCLFILFCFSPNLLSQNTWFSWVVTLCLSIFYTLFLVAQCQKAIWNPCIAHGKCCHHIGWNCVQSVQVRFSKQLVDIRNTIIVEEII